MSSIKTTLYHGWKISQTQSKHSKYDKGKTLYRQLVYSAQNFLKHMIVKKRITNSSSVKVLCFLSTTFTGFVLAKRKKNIKQKNGKKKTKRYNKQLPIETNKSPLKRYIVLLFLMVDVALIYVATWCNEVRSTKSQTFRLLVIIIQIYRFSFFGILILKYCKIVMSLALTTKQS